LAVFLLYGPEATLLMLMFVQQLYTILPQARGNGFSY